MKRHLFATALLCTLLCAACTGDDYTPKPRTFVRLDLPDKAYTLCDTAVLPFRFERATDAQMTVKRRNASEIWVDLTYPDYRGLVYLSYKPLRKPADLPNQIDTSYRLLKMHFDQTSGVEEKQYIDAAARVFATTYRLKGSAVASTFQFWATDSVQHFLRGSLFLDCPPRNDSLAPVLDYLQQDLIHLVETLRWRNNPSSPTRP
ncbi:MAG: hypothetical protein IJV22_05365 [Bacteroidales bacterium]|nr:hypothetical protein [Bacteroidales bacterium]